VEPLANGVYRLPQSKPDGGPQPGRLTE
jgi:hypothetical protein